MTTAVVKRHHQSRSRLNDRNAHVHRLTKSRKKRIAAVVGTLAIMSSYIAFRLVSLQVDADTSAKVKSLAATQRFKRVSIPGQRGSIFDRNGDELAISVPQPTIWANPKLVVDKKSAAESLAAITNQPVEKISGLLEKDAQFVYIARKVDQAIADQIKQLSLAGVYQEEEPKRFYPNGDLARSVIGTVGIDNQGLSGLEYANEDWLAGADGKLVAEKDKRGREVAGGVKDFTPATQGTDVILTIERGAQYEAERLLSDQIVASNALGGMLVVLDVKTGDVIANANLKVDERGGVPQQDDSNSSVTDVFEPGSTNKLVTVAAALQENLVTPSTPFQVADSLQVGDHLFSDHDPHATKSWNTTDILTYSSNIGTIQIAQMLGKNRLDSYLRDFGFGSKTDLNWPGESRGILLPPKSWVSTTIGSVPLGQGMSVTALQMAAAYNAIANGGIYVSPRIIRATIDKNGNTVQSSPSTTRRVVDYRVAQQLSGMLTQVVKHGTGTHAAFKGYDVAGKTGTAQKPVVNGLGYQKGAYVSSFAGFFPAERPEYTILVVLDEPNPIYGGLVAAPLFSEIGSYIARTQHATTSLTKLNLAELGIPAPKSLDAAAGDLDTASVKSNQAVFPYMAAFRRKATTTTTNTTGVEPSADVTVDPEGTGLNTSVKSGTPKR